MFTIPAHRFLSSSRKTLQHAYSKDFRHPLLSSSAQLANTQTILIKVSIVSGYSEIRGQGVRRSLLTTITVSLLEKSSLFLWSHTGKEQLQSFQKRIYLYRCHSPPAAKTKPKHYICICFPLTLTKKKQKKHTHHVYIYFIFFKTHVW